MESSKQPTGLNAEAKVTQPIAVPRLIISETVFRCFWTIFAIVRTDRPFRWRTCMKSTGTLCWNWVVHFAWNRSDILISPDTAIVHLCSAIEKNLVALYRSELSCRSRREFFKSKVTLCLYMLFEFNRSIHIQKIFLERLKNQENIIFMILLRYVVMNHKK